MWEKQNMHSSLHSHNTKSHYNFSITTQSSLYPLLFVVFLNKIFKFFSLYFFINLFSSFFHEENIQLGFLVPYTSCTPFIVILLNDPFSISDNNDKNDNIQGYLPPKLVV
eukprot:175546_1